RRTALVVEAYMAPTSQTVNANLLPV
ncbi:hypothetical protein M2281_005693, partial [Mesorhizobium soli]|nr:hypothetical protein [Mesorhizobium soli]